MPRRIRDYLLDDRVRIVEADYRTHNGEYSRVAPVDVARTRDLYVPSCEAGFRTRTLRDAQLMLER